MLLVLFPFPHIPSSSLASFSVAEDGPTRLTVPVEVSKRAGTLGDPVVDGWARWEARSMERIVAQSSLSQTIQAIPFFYSSGLPLAPSCSCFRTAGCIALCATCPHYVRVLLSISGFVLTVWERSAKIDMEGVNKKEDRAHGSDAKVYPHTLKSAFPSLAFLRSNEDFAHFRMSHYSLIPPGTPSPSISQETALIPSSSILSFSNLFAASNVALCLCFTRRFIGYSSKIGRNRGSGRVWVYEGELTGSGFFSMHRTSLSALSTPPSTWILAEVF
ncbi:hypothetical protein NMY22_g12895 [Coprinellus aureogranulatus]|nr:hypothetical protein NMY22_g12895 [Coprinellus aureogranulatus]